MSPDAQWVRLSGGRTNPVWRVDGGSRALVCKLYHQAAVTPLFANDPDREERALRVLRGTGLAPDLIATAHTPVGHSLLYAHVPGAPWRKDAAPVGATLAQLHALPLPPAIPAIEVTAQAILNNTRTMAAQVPGGADFTSRLPDLPDENVGTVPAVLLHGDPVPGNILTCDGRVTLIDWQCPAVGDPCHDIALFLSPAMQWVNDNPPLTPEQEAAFWEGYSNPQTQARYRALAPYFHARMQAYCLWKVAQGDKPYARAAQLEKDRSEQC